MPAETQITLIVLAAGLLFFIIFLVFRRGIKIGSKGLGISIDGPVQTSTNASPHANCKHRHDAMDTIRKVWENTEKRGRIRDTESVKKQMALAELYVKRALSTLSHIYLSTLKKAGYVDPVSTVSFVSYKNVLIILECRIVAEVRHYIRENHFAEKDGREFDTYVDSKTKQLVDVTSAVLNDVYLYKDDITRSELHDANMSVMKDFGGLVSDFFYECRDIAREAKAEIERLDRETEDLFNRFKN